MSVVDKIGRATAKTATIISGVLILCVFIVIFIGIVGRVFGKSPAWTEELSRWGLVAICFSGASAALYGKQHVGVNMFIQRCPFKFSRVLVFLSYICVIILCLYFGYYCFLAALKTRNLKGDIIPFSMIYVKMFLPLGFFMLVIQLVTGMIKIFDKQITIIDDILLGK